MSNEVCPKCGVGELVEDDNGECCSCHINPPCSYCVSKKLVCTDCGEEYGN